MYRTRTGTRRIQRGGDYVSTLSSISSLNLPGSVQLSSLSALAGVAGLSTIPSSIEGWTSLSVERIGELIKNLTYLINSDSGQASNLDGQIAEYNRQIDTNPNYQSTFNEANRLYISVSTQYNNVQASIKNANDSYSSDNSTLSSYYQRYQELDSTLQSYWNSYSSFLVLYQGATSMIDIQQSTVNSYIKSYSGVSTVCGVGDGLYRSRLTTFQNLSTNAPAQITAGTGGLRNQIQILSTLRLNYNRAAISTYTTQAARGNVTSSLNTQIISTNSSIQRTNFNLSSIVNGVLNAFNDTAQASTAIGTCPADMAVWSTNVSQSQGLLNRYVEISTTYVVNSVAYWSTINYWSTLERQAQSTIDAYSSQKASLLGRKLWLSGEIDRLKGALGRNLTSLDGLAAQFYSTKKVQLVNETREFRNASLQLSAYMGWLASEYMIKVIQLDDVIDNNNFYIQQANLLGGDTSQFITARDDALGNQITLQSQAQDYINKYDVQFNQLDQLYADEIQLKTDFIDIRSTLTMMERSVIANPALKLTIQQTYGNANVGLWKSMNDKLTQVNTKIGDRFNKWRNISTTIVNDQIAYNFNILNTKYPNTFPNWPTFLIDYAYTNTPIPNPQPQDVSTGTYMTTSEYTLLPAIDFSKPPANYRIP
jgi:hypothetical protein